MNKRILMLLIISIFFINLITTNVFAQEEGGILPAISRISKAMFFDASRYIGEAYVFKFMIWIVVFIIFNIGTKRIFSEHPKSAMAIAFFLSFGSVLLIPNTVVVRIFTIYRTVVATLLIILPAGIGFWLHHAYFSEDTGGNNFWSGLIFIIAGWVFGSAFETLKKGGIGIPALTTTFDIGRYICFAIGIWYLVSMFKGPAKIDVGEAAGEYFPTAKKWIAPSKEEKEKKTFKRALKRWKKSDLRLIYEEKEERKKTKLIKPAYDVIKGILIDVLGDTSPGAVITNRQSVDLVSEEFKKAVDEAKDHFKRLKSPYTFREYSRLNRLIKLLKVKGKSTSRIESIEGDLLRVHEETAAKLDEILTDWTVIGPLLKKVRAKMGAQTELLLSLSFIITPTMTITLRMYLTDVLTTVELLEPKIDEVEELEKKALAHLEGVIIEVDKEVKELEE